MKGINAKDSENWLPATKSNTERNFACSKNQKQFSLL